MVLSNKKLKLQARALLAEALASSEQARNHSIKSDSAKPDSNSQTPKSLKSLLGSAIQKPRLSKREKRRKDISLKGPEDVKKNVVAASDKEIGEEGGEKKKSKKRKRKKEEEPESGVSEPAENGEEEKLKKKKKKKKKKKRKKSEKKVEVEKTANEGIEQPQAVMEATVASESQEPEEVTTKVYVGGIPYYSTEDDIRSFFEGCGSLIEIDCMRFPETGKFRGIAIINFRTEAAAKRALALDGSDMGGFFLKIKPYKSTKPQKKPDFCPGFVEGYNRIYAGNLSWDITEEDLRKLFSGCSIETIRFGEDKETGEFRGYAHVDFSDTISLNKALKLDQKLVCGRPVKVTYAVPKTVNGVIQKPAATTPVATTQEAAATEEVDNGGDVAVSGKIRRRTCYECGEKGHITSSCPKKPAAAVPVPPPLPVAATPQEAATQKVDNGGAAAVSGKIRRRTCYECGEKGHLTSSCPNKLLPPPPAAAAPAVTIPVVTTPAVTIPVVTTPAVTTQENTAGEVSGGSTAALSGKIRRRTCYECGEKGHLSSACPKKLAELGSSGPT